MSFAIGKLSSRPYHPPRTDRGSVCTVKRTSGSYRHIKHLLYEEGYTIAGASKKLKSNGHLSEDLPLFQIAGQRKDQQQLDEIKKDLQDLLKDLDAEP